MKFSNIWHHFKKVCTHKYWVAKYCFMCGLYWQGITHDLSKFSFTEFWESVKYYQGDRSPVKAVKEKYGYSPAWLHHRGRNKHHYEYWTDNFDNGVTCILIPYKYAVELICDYLGAARAYMGDKFSYRAEYEWWVKEKQNAELRMHPCIQNFINCVLFELSQVSSNGGNVQDVLKTNNLKAWYKLNCDNSPKII